MLLSFPFTDRSGERVRPALVVGALAGDDVIVAFVTSRTDGGDPRAEHEVSPAEPEFAATGLRLASRIRLSKLATLHRDLVRRRIGRIGRRTQAAVDGRLRYVLGL